MFVLSDAIGYREHYWVIFALGIIYIIWNYLTYRWSGVSIYPFLFDWVNENNGFFFTMKFIALQVGGALAYFSVVEFQ